MRPFVGLFTVAALSLCILFVGPRSAEAALRFVGVNIAGAEFGPRKLPGRPGTDYFYPTPATIDYFAGKGMNTLRIPFRWERLQPELGKELDPDELKRLDATVGYATAKGMNVILDVHNYAAYSGQIIGTPAIPPDALPDLWRRLGAHYKDNDNVIFGLMNEPKGLATETWLAAANAAIAAIRQTGARNLVLVPGNGWSGAHSWFGNSYGAANADVMLGVVDPANNVAFEVHQYLDGNYSGTSPQCKSQHAGAEALSRFTQWLRDNRKRGFLGEFGAGPDPLCLVALDAMLKLMDDNSDVWLGWTYWAAGPWPRDYFTSVQPAGAADAPQMKTLLKYVPQAEGLAK